MTKDNFLNLFLHENISAPTVQINSFQKFRETKKQIEGETIKPLERKSPNNETQQNHNIILYIHNLSK